MQKVLLIKNHTQQDLSNNSKAVTSCKLITSCFNDFLLNKWLIEYEIEEADFYEPYYKKDDFLQSFDDLETYEAIGMIELLEEKERELNLQLIKKDDKQDSYVIAENTLKLLQELKQ